MMAGLIDGSFAPAVGDIAAQQHFFSTHVEPVAPRFFADLEKADAARFYRPVARVGRHFLEVEASAFQMVCQFARTSEDRGHEDEEGQGLQIRSPRFPEACRDRSGGGRRRRARRGKEGRAAAADAPSGRGYRETEHVRKFYRSARF